MSTIKSVVAREILDSRGGPTVEVDLVTEDGVFRAGVPSGASTGTHEALELRDGDNSRYGGKGVLKAVDNVNKKIALLVQGMDVTKQSEIDQKMIAADGTENKGNFGANAILAVSLAACRAGAAAKKMPLYQHIAELGGNKKFILPVPMVLVLEGGKHADQSSDIQEFMIMPYKAKSFKEAIRWGSEIYQAIGKVLKSQGFNVNVGFEGAYGPSLGSNEKALQVIVEGIKAAGYKPGKEVLIAIDSAASEFFKDGQYCLKVDGRTFNSKGMADFYSDLCKKYPIISIEDGLAEDDWDSWALLTKQIGRKIQIMGDDLIVTNVKRLQKAIDIKAANSVLIKLNQIGTVTETISAINLARKNRMSSIVSHRSSETEDTFISDLVVGMGTGQSKFGATARSERVAKYNELMRIEEELGKNCRYAGTKFRRP
jgi:enolase